MGFDVFFQGLIVTVLVMASYLIGHRIESGVWEFVNSADGTTMAFLTLSMVENLSFSEYEKPPRFHL